MFNNNLVFVSKSSKDMFSGKFIKHGLDCLRYTAVLLYSLTFFWEKIWCG